MKIARLAVAVALASLAACKSAPETRPELAPPSLPQEELQVVSQNLTDCAVKYEGTIESPDQAVTVEKAVYEFVVDGAVLKKGEKALGLSIAAGQKASFALEESFTYVKSDEELKAMDARGGSLLAALRGNLVVKVTVPAAGDQPATTQSLEVPFARSKEIRTPRLPHLKLIEFEAGRFSESEVQVVYHVGVVNPNPFTVSLSSLVYTVDISGKQVSKGTLGAGERVSPASTGVFDITATANEETHGKDIVKLIKGLVLPYSLNVAMNTAMYTEPLEAKGEIKLTKPK